MYPTDLTVAAVVRDRERYLIVEESSSGHVVLSQPGGHIESGEAPEQALEREVLEETACVVRCSDLIGVYLWIHPQTRQQFLRLMYAAEFVTCVQARSLDDGIIARHWLTRADLEAKRAKLRSPVVLRSVYDFEAGRRESDMLIAGMHPLQQNVDLVLARADLV
ncbi:MAG: NUDIX domain-containing protein [Woeseiaceae bacterium]|nr:NUDIX domain-containing protein [Woeseiaceae bacterium]